MRRLAGSVLTALITFALVGCGGSTTTSAVPASSAQTGSTRPSTASPSGSTSTATSAPVTPTTTGDPLPSVKPYNPLPSEQEPEVKATAARFLELVSTYELGGGSLTATQNRLATAQLPPELAREVTRLLDDAAASVGEIIYPQLAGLTGSQASVMALLRQTSQRAGGEATTVTRSIDVRLERAADGWRVTGVTSDGGAPPDSSAPPPLPQQVLDSARLSMSDSARWDVASGRIDDRLLRLVLTLAETYTLDITVFATGHPANVFGEMSVSNHTEGRGIDIWAVDGQPVIGAASDGPATAAVVAALQLGATEVGSPWDVDGPGGPSFANALHADHLHLAFDG